MKKWLLVAGMVLAGLILSGCATPETKRLRFYSAVERNDTPEIKQAFLDASKGKNKERSIIYSRGLRVLSEEYKREFLSGGLDGKSLQSFDEKCRSEIREQCSSASRSDVQWALYDHRKALQDSDRKRRLEIAVREIRDGEREIKTREEAIAYYQPLPGDTLAHSPSISGGDGEYYLLQAYITAKRGNRYIYWWADSPVVQHGIYGMPAMGAVFDNPSLIQDGVGFNQHVDVIGKYVDNQKLNLTNGSTATVPVFEDVYIFRWQRH